MARAAVLGRLTWRVAQLADVRDETATARTLILDVPGWPGHLPGQHVDVRLTAEDGYSTERSYSIASAPGGSRLELTIQRLEDGEVSPYLAQTLSRGDPLELRGPIGGYFAWRAADPAPVLLIGGGSGVVPLMAMVRTRIAGDSAVPMHLIYSTRSPDALLYAAELEHIAAQRSGLAVDIVYTRAAPPDRGGSGGGGGSGGRGGSADRVGRLDAGRLAELTGVARGAGLACFVCGPTGFVESIANLLIDQGLTAGQVKTERFGPSGGTP
jgi:ferredoxin-NADP reductase